MRDEVQRARRLIEAMPKAELHLHLDGGLRPRTALDLARTRGVAAPDTYAGMVDALVGPRRTASQADLLRYFDLPIALLQDADALRRVAAEAVTDKAHDNVRYVELRWAPGLHTQGGLDIDEVISAVAEGASAAATGLGIEVRLCVVGFRTADPAVNAEIAAAGVRGRPLGVSGFDLAGYEAAAPDPTVHRDAFDVARAGGLGVTVHAGELAGGAEHVRRALDLRPDRIAHGAAAWTDPVLVAELAERGVTLDLCPTSNVQVGLVDRVADHPLPLLLRAGVAATISTDDRTVADITLSEELLACHTELGLGLDDLWACTLHALDVAFVDEPTRDRLRAEFRAWAEGVTELGGTSPWHAATVAQGRR